MSHTSAPIERGQARYSGGMKRTIARALGLAVLVVIAVGCHSGAASPVVDAGPNLGASSPPPDAPPPGQTLVAFPGAEGFGATTKGGRDGAVCVVTTLAKSGPGSLAGCLEQRGPRTVVFRVSGIIDGPLEIKHGELTIAGQTAPGGITIKGGLVCDNVYDPNDCNEVIVRHVRLRRGAPDAMRIGGAHHVILDHVSLANAEDENLEISRSRDVTVSYAMIAEPLGEHYRYGGILINYSKDTLPLDRISIHHSAFSGVAGRLPEVSCEENDDGPGKSACGGRTLAIDVINNVYQDVHDPIWYNRCTGTNEGNDCAPSSRDFLLELNLIGNVMVRRSSADPDLPFVDSGLHRTGQNKLYLADNWLGRGASSLVPVTLPVAGASAPFAHPQITVVAASSLVTTLAKTVGAFPRDAMDTRLVGYLTHSVDARPAAWADERGVDRGDGLTPLASAPAPVDSDDDGMPDDWEKAHGLDPQAFSANARLATDAPSGYTALERYLAELADRLH